MADKLVEFIINTLCSRLKELPEEEMRRGITVGEVLDRISTAELFQAMPPEAMEALLQRAKERGLLHDRG